MKSVCSCLWLGEGWGGTWSEEQGQRAMWMCTVKVGGGAFLIEDPRESHVEVNEGGGPQVRQDSDRWPWGALSQWRSGAAQIVMRPCQKARHSRKGRDCQNQVPWSTETSNK